MCGAAWRDNLGLRPPDLVRRGWGNTVADGDGISEDRESLRSASVDELTTYFAQLANTPGGNASGSGFVEHVETHLSHVFLCGELVYKLLKPVKFAFVDFSTIERRREECRAEVSLNRPLAGDVYLAAVPVVRLAEGGIEIAEDATVQTRGTIVDWAVKMRRLPAGQTLDALVRRGEATVSLLDGLVALLAQHYAATARSPIRASEYLAAIESHVRENLAELSRADHSLPRSVVDRVHAGQLTALAICGDWFEQRIDKGRIVEGHGDLRPEHVYFAPQPVVIDCLAFNAELRTLDLADEVAFLAMELRQLGSGALADGLIGAFETRTGDHPPAGLWSFYQAYRACVRAKVAVLLAIQLNEPQRAAERAAARRYLELADAVLKPHARPMCIVVRGLSGSGKSTLAAALAKSLGIVHLETDRIRKQLFPGATATGYGQGCYTSAARRIVYDAMRAQAGERLSEGQSVILDGTFLSAASRTSVVDMASRLQIPTLVLECRCPAQLATERLTAREAQGQSLSDANTATAQRQPGEEEPDPPGLNVVVVDTAAPLSDQVAVSCSAIRAACNATKN
jgi:aminoglycoside phosphotransferase family enzyme/predicted kinase